MSQILKLDNQDVQYVYDDADLVLDPSDLNDDIIYINGQILQGDGQTIVLQDGNDLGQYYSGEFIIAEDNELANASSLDVQYIDDSSQEVVYITNDDFNLPEGYQVEQNKTVVDLDDIILNEGAIGEAPEGEYQYAVLKDGKLHIQTYDASQLEDDGQTLDLSQITGKNLLTGQTVTLYNYIDKLQKRNKDFGSGDEKPPTGDLNNLLNKKIPLCKPVNGKRLVGKIISIEKNRVDEEEKLISAKVQPEEVIITRQIVTKEEEDHIARTLVGIMGMDSVKKKLIMKNIVVKLLEKTYGENSEVRKRVLYSSGYMEENLNDQDELEWVYMSGIQSHFKDTVNITIQLTIMSNEQRQVKVILNDNFECRFCFKKFSSQGQVKSHSKICTKQKTCFICDLKFDGPDDLEKHLKSTHQSNGKFWCNLCGKTFPNYQRLRRHSIVHTGRNRTYECETCNQKFANMSTLKKHMLNHVPVRPFECGVCSKKFTNSGDLNYHKRIHDLNNYFQCETCGRAFSRYSNLMRHVEIHKGNEALYQCDVCGSSYNYISSLTRHIVQNHISKDEELTPMS